MIEAALVLGSILAVYYLIFYFFFPLGRGAIYYPSTREHAELMAELAAISAGEMAVDLGSGDGRVLVALARRGAEAHGFEINPLLVLLSRRNIRRADLHGRAFVHWKSFWRADLSRFTVVTVFQGGFVMRRLERKLRRELPRGSRVISDFWRLPGMSPELARGTLCVYRIGGPEA